MTDKLRDAAQQAPMAYYSLVIKADSGYESTTEGRCTADQYGAAMAALHGTAALAQQDAQAVVQDEIVAAWKSGMTVQYFVTIGHDDEWTDYTNPTPPDTSGTRLAWRVKPGQRSNAAPTPPAQQDAQTGSPDHGELYAQGWLNGTQVQSLIDWCNSYPRKLPNVAFTEGTVRQVAYAIHNSLMLQQTKELAFAVDRLKKLVNLVYRGDYSKTETKEWWDHVEKVLKDTQAFCALPYEHLQDCAPDAAPRQPAQRVLMTDEEISRIFTEQTGADIDDSPWALRDFARAVIEAYKKKNGTK